MKKKSATLVNITQGQEALMSKYSLDVAFEDATAAAKMNEFDAMKWQNWVDQRRVLNAQAKSENPVYRIPRSLYGGPISALMNNEAPEARELLAA